MSEQSLEIPIEQIYRPGSALDMPVRPRWTYDMTKEYLEQQEKDYFAVRLVSIVCEVNQRILSSRHICKKSLLISKAKILAISK
jgi:hypothetical protein